MSDLPTLTACLVRLQNRSRLLLDALAERRTSERGASVIEYGLLIALIALAAIVGIRFLGGRISSSYSNTAEIYPS